MNGIKLLNGEIAVVSDGDFETLAKWKWHANSGGYPVRYTKIGTRRIAVFMHREVAMPPTGFEVDHINGQPLDNRRENLRICTRAENARNRCKKPCTTSKFKGVYRHRNGRYKASITFALQQKHLGYFEDEVAAALAYDVAAMALHGEFASTNFARCRNPTQGPEQDSRVRGARHLLSSQ